ncbi:hypothetical protein MMC27_006213 [Xylographa pallens]|nr:hypothetical protein [Xylographa pallens]
MNSEASPLVEVETDLIVEEADDPPPDTGNPSTPHMQASHAEDEADQDRFFPPPQRDPYTIEVTPVHECTDGYPQLAAFAGCDPNFAIYRQFKTVRHRCLLYMQDELRALEHDLEQLDLQDTLTNPSLLSCRSRDASQDPSRRMELLARIKDKIGEYDQMLRSTRALMHWPPPTERNRRAYVNYINNKQPTVERESRFIRRSDDLVTLAGDLQNSWLDGTIGGLIDKTWPRLAAAVFRTKAQALLLTNNTEIRLVGKARFDTFVRCIVACSIAVLLMASLFAIPWAQRAGFQSEEAVLLLTGVFALLAAVFTDAKRGELVAATAGYV